MDLTLVTVWTLSKAVYNIKFQHFKFLLQQWLVMVSEQSFSLRFNKILYPFVDFQLDRRFNRRLIEKEPWLQTKWVHGLSRILFWNAFSHSFYVLFSDWHSQAFTYVCFYSVYLKVPFTLINDWNGLLVTSFAIFIFIFVTDFFIVKWTCLLWQGVCIPKGDYFLFLAKTSKFVQEDQTHGWRWLSKKKV